MAAVRMDDSKKKTGGKQGRMGKGRRTTGAAQDQLPGGAGSFIQKLDSDRDREKEKERRKCLIDSENLTVQQKSTKQQ